MTSTFYSVLMKVYYDAGLVNLAECSGHRGETLTSIQKSSSYNRTRQFLLQAWETMYRQMFEAFKNARDSDSDGDSSISDVIAAVKANMLECNKKMGENESDSSKSIKKPETKQRTKCSFVKRRPLPSQNVDDPYRNTTISTYIII